MINYPEEQGKNLPFVSFWDFNTSSNIGNYASNEEKDLKTLDIPSNYVIKKQFRYIFLLILRNDGLD